MPWTTPETFTAGQTLTAASMNIISDDLSAIAPDGIGAWASYTPTISGGSITLGTGGVIAGKYLRVGRAVIVQAGFALGTGGSLSGGPLSFSLPVGAATTTSRIQIGTVWMYDASGAAYALGVCELQSAASTVQFRVIKSGGTFDGLGGANPWTWAASDSLALSITYEAAS